MKRIVMEKHQCIDIRLECNLYSIIVGWMPPLIFCFIFFGSVLRIMNQNMWVSYEVNQTLIIILNNFSFIGIVAILWGIWINKVRFIITYIYHGFVVDIKFVSESITGVIQVHRFHFHTFDSVGSFVHLLELKCRCHLIYLHRKVYRIHLIRQNILKF